MRVPITAAVGIMLLLTLLLQGCGHKGPLLLPAAKPVQPTPQSTSQPVPQQAPQPAPAK